MNKINPERIVLFGGSFNPPGEHHRKILEFLINLGWFHKVIVVPCGPRPEIKKQSLNDVPPEYREKIVRRSFADIYNLGTELVFDLFDLYNEVYTTTDGLQVRYQRKYPNAEIWHYAGSDLVIGGARGKAEIQGWGDSVWEKLNWFIVQRPKYYVLDKDLPPHCQLHEEVADGSSTELRKKLSDGLDEGEVMKRIAPLLEEFNPYAEVVQGGK